MITAVLVYIPVAYLADRSIKKPFVVITFFNFTIFPLVILFSQSFAMMGYSLCYQGVEGIWRADAQGSDYGSGAGGQKSGNVRTILFDPRCNCFHRRIWRSIPLADIPRS